MLEMTLSQTANLFGLDCIVPDINFQGVTIDSRNAEKGNLFVALRGMRVDGHDFVEEAYQKGAAAAIVGRQVPSPLPQLVVKDPALALGQLASDWRNKFDIPFIAVTGSNGKTTLKNMIASIMIAACQGHHEQVLKSEGTFNNHLGLPLTLSRLNKEHRYAAIEMGMNHFGEIEYLTKITRPNVAVINNAAAAHLEGVGDLAGVAKAKAEIFSGLQQNGVAILNRDDAFFTFWHQLINHHDYLTFGFHPDADIRGTLHNSSHHQQMTLHTPNGNIDIHLPLLGKHNALNTLAAAAASLAIGIDLPAIKMGLENIQAAPGRMQLYTLANGVNIIDDTYNANPFSLEAAIHTLSSFKGKKILVLADMKELGNEAKTLHHSAGKTIREAGIDTLFTYGELSANTSQAFGEGAYHFNEQEKLVTALKPFLYNQTTILVKGSRSMHMEKVVAELIRE